MCPEQECLPELADKSTARARAPASCGELIQDSGVVRLTVYRRNRLGCWQADGPPPQPAALPVVRLTAYRRNHRAGVLS